MVVKSKNKVAIIILIFVVVNFGFLIVGLDVGLNLIHVGKNGRHKGDHVGTHDPLLAREFPRHPQQGPSKDATANSGSLGAAAAAREANGAVVVGAQ